MLRQAQHEVLGLGLIQGLSKDEAAKLTHYPAQRCVPGIDNHVVELAKPRDGADRARRSRSQSSMSDQPNKADTAGVLIPPPLIYLGAVALGFGLDAVLPIRFAAGGLDDALQYGVGGALMLIAFAIIAVGVTQFRRAGTNVAPIRPTTALVTHGIYALSRNPLYISLSLLMAGIAVAADRLWILVLLAPVLVVMRYGVIAREERYLERKFGETYRQYKARVRRWL
jgi:flagellin-like protein